MNDHPPTSSSHPSFHRSMSQPSDIQAEDGSIWGVAQSVPMAQPVPPGNMYKLVIIIGCNEEGYPLPDG